MNKERPKFVLQKEVVRTGDTSHGMEHELTKISMDAARETVQRLNRTRARENWTIQIKDD